MYLPLLHLCFLRANSDTEWINLCLPVLYSCYITGSTSKVLLLPQNLLNLCDLKVVSRGLLVMIGRFLSFFIYSFKLATTDPVWPSWTWSWSWFQLHWGIKERFWLSASCRCLSSIFSQQFMFKIGDERLKGVTAKRKKIPHLMGLQGFYCNTKHKDTMKPTGLRCLPRVSTYECV